MTTIPSPYFLWKMDFNGLYRRRPQYPVGSWEAPRWVFPLLHQRCSDAGSCGKVPTSKSPWWFCALKGKLPHGSQLSSEVHYCSLALLALSFSFCSRPPAQVAVVLALSRQPPGDSWLPGSRIGPLGKERRAGVGFRVRKQMFPRPFTKISPNSAVFYGLGLPWGWIFPGSFQAGILRTVTIIDPSSLNQRRP